ncbi:MAG: hypothetical protein A2X11_14325 [Bacteroidetes bacterium GWE2_42_24]|nr:MAG: hypothetical protein A2X11_14325 [Bacteroidetes bacterium GWE2_42_24]OFY31531.1 MAG: hypothetical protein A2X09_08065 [Bacteroidetes bacterium GWF2_43_11]
MKYSLFLFLILFLNSDPGLGISGGSEKTLKPGHDLECLAIPSYGNGLLILNRKGFTVGFDTNHRQAFWVAYMLTPGELVPLVKRSNSFYSDIDVKGWVAVDADYKKSGYDRGHLAPAADMSWSDSTMLESFGYVNISPQKPTFNRGIWKKLEEQVRAWTKANDTLWIVTGPLIDRKVDTMRLRNKVTVPGRFYKALLRHHRQRWQTIAFLMPNSGSKANIWEYSIAVDELEAAIGIDFFPALPDSVECRVERVCELKEWFKQLN